ncbi:hypothetical protein DL771_011716 [Monosporascus sp. 5C6A]|nr:hypothetical protein DL771_011716 [Monosporascus sp. 5C6A]
MPKREFSSEDNQDAATGAEKRRKITFDDARTPAADIAEPRVNDDYTVGWICAISTEYVAAQAFLDEKHDRPEYVSPNDNNDYTLGEIGKHKVVIAVLPDGEYGIASAAIAARDMLHSFPNIRVGLMVGIGGGAPSQKHDIRLGDIVVSAPRNGKGGVFQYDFGKTIQDQSFRTTGFLNQPPTVLRAAVNGLKAQYESDGHQLEEAINTILEKKPRLQKKYKRPDLNNDRLYRSEVTHLPNDELRCSVICGDDPSKLVLRPERPEDEDNPAIHYGLIASADQLMKDATIRDKLAMEKDVLCFEMEAAGLMNHFPCLVIRGICDYSDTHKNKEWQGYAAMTAAAYAKDLLRRILPSKVEAERRISELLRDADIKAVKSKLQRNENIEILNWLTPVDYGPQQKDFLERRQPGTGQWLLDSAEFQAWLKADQQALFCPGIPGAGKTTITSIVIEHLKIEFQNSPTEKPENDPFDRDSNIGIAYLYCSFQRQHEQGFEHLLANLLKQLSQDRTPLPHAVEALYKRHRNGQTKPTLAEMSTTLQSVANMYSRMFIVIDALDECVSDGCRGRLLSEIFSLRAAGANILVTSRPIQEIKEHFKGYVHALAIRITKSTIDEDDFDDINTMVSDHVFCLTPESHEDSTVSDNKKNAIALAEAHKTITTTCVTYLSFSTFESGFCPTDDEFERRLRSNLFYNYAAHNWGLHGRIASTLCCEVIDFLQHETKVEAASQALMAVKSWRSGYSQEVPRQMTGLHLAAYFGIQEAAIILLRHGQRPDLRDTHGRTPLWRAASQGHEAVVKLLLEKGADVEGKSNYDGRTPLWRAAENGHEAVVKLLLEKGADVEAKSKNDGRTPLSRAAQNGHEAVVKLLLAEGVEADSKVTGQYITGRTPFSWAAENGYEAVVKLLLAKGVNANSKATSQFIAGRTPLSYAAENGHEAVVKLLLAEGVDANSKATNENDTGRTPLSYAAQKGHEAVVKLLLAVGVNADSKTTGQYITGRTPLSYAAENGHEVVVKLLLAEGVAADSKATGQYHTGRTPLSYAAQNGYEAVVKLLLAKGVNADSKAIGQYIAGRTPLSYAAENGHEAVVKLLLAKGVDADLKATGHCY